MAPELVPAHLEHAYHGRSRGSAHGEDHVVVDADLRVGRFFRAENEPLCRPRSRFWGLYDDLGESVTEPSCTVCQRRLAQYPIRLMGVIRPDLGPIVGGGGLMRVGELTRTWLYRDGRLAVWDLETRMWFRVHLIDPAEGDDPQALVTLWSPGDVARRFPRTRRLAIGDTNSADLAGKVSR